MVQAKSKLFKLSMNVLMIFFCYSYLSSQTTVLTIKSIEDTEKGFLVKGVVIMSNLNPGGQIVERDDCSIFADIKKEPDSVYPLLPDYYKIITPKDVETSFLKGKRYLTRKEYYGVNIHSHPVAGFSPRGFNIWRDYGGLGIWHKKAPTSVSLEFEGIIPKQYAGKTVRIRASLKHQWGGPYSNWSAYSFHHDIGHEGILKTNNIKKPDSHKIYIAAGPSGKPNPAATGESVQCKITGKDTRNHKLLYEWTVKPQAGTFNDPAIQNPVWTAPVNTMQKTRNYTITCTITCPVDSSLKETGSFVQEVCPLIKPVSIILRISADGFETYEKKTKPFKPRYQRIILDGFVMPIKRNSGEAGRIGADTQVFAELIVMCEGKEVRAKRMWTKMYSDYWLPIDLTEFAGCTKRAKTIRKKNIWLKPTDSYDQNDKDKSEQQKNKEMYDKLLNEKFANKKGFRRILALLGLYKAYQNDRVHMATGKKGTPALNKFFKNLRQGPVGEMKNAINTIWEFGKSPLTLGGSDIEDMIQNTNKACESYFGKGFLKKSIKGPNAISDTGIELKNKLLQFEKIK